MYLIKVNNFFVAYQRQGNNFNGNPVYILNFFDGDNLHNINYKIDHKKDKYNNIKIVSYNIQADINYLIDSINNK